MKMALISLAILFNQMAYADDTQDAVEQTSCWSRVTYVTGQAFNPNKFAAQNNAKSAYIANLKPYRNNCEVKLGCKFYAPQPGFPTCIAIGSNWQCRVSAEVQCLKPTEPS